jgi:hypothetical protein
MDEIAVMGRQAVSAFWLSTIGLPADVVITGGSLVDMAVRLPWLIPCFPVVGASLPPAGDGVK